MLDHDHQMLRIHKNNKTINDYHKYKYSELINVSCPQIQNRDEKSSV